jgi:coenzyme F420-0:L-glutamate ligase
MTVFPIKTRVFKEGESLVEFITAHIPKLKDGSVLVVTSKIVALAEGRTADAKDKQSLVRKESQWALRAPHGLLTLRAGILMWNAGIDSSNAGPGKIVLLPADCFRSAQSIRRALKERYGVKRLGVIITDSRTMPLRVGVVGIALGYAGFRGVKDYRGKTDIFGDVYRLTRTDVADSLATSAVFLMGEGKEQRPLAVIEDAPVEFCETVKRKELIVPIEEDMYRPLFKRLPRRR